MGGKEGGRGYLYQGMASVIEAATQDNWERIYIELQTENDKVDIALETSGIIKTAIQVKSTINSFSKSSLIQWLAALRKDYTCTEYRLFLLGQCEKDAITFIKSVKKYKNDCMDQESTKCLSSVDCLLLKDAEISFTVLPVDLDTLLSILRDKLSCYLSQNGCIMTHDRISFIANATITDQMLLSTDGSFISRDAFNLTLQERIRLLSDNYMPPKTAVYVRSFNWVRKMDSTQVQYAFDLADKFNIRSLKSEFEWKQDVYDELESFLRSSTDNENAYELYLDTHMSIAFSAGRILNTKQGINAFPIQKTISGEIVWDVNPFDSNKYSGWDISHTQLDDGVFDSVIVLNVTHDITSHVQEYIDEMNLKVGRLINCHLNKNGATNFSISNGTHAARLASSIYGVLAQRSTPERRATLHVFASAPNAFMFFLGQVSVSLGKIIIYEYDFEQQNSCTYEPAIQF